MLSVLRKEPHFKNLWLGQAISQAGDALYFLIFLYMVDRITGNPAMVGFIGAVQALPYLIFGPWAGALVDRVDRRRLLLISDIAATLLLVAFGILVWQMPKPPLPLIFAVAFSLSMLNVVFVPAKSAAVPRLVRPENLQEANALSMATQNLMPILGLSVSAGVLSAVEKSWPGTFFVAAILFNAGTFAWSAYWISRLPAIEPEPPKEHVSQWEQVRAGLKYTFGQPVLRTALAVAVVLQLFISPFMVAHIAVNNRWFDGRFVTLASFEIGFFLPVIVVSLIVGKRKIVQVGRAYLASLGLLALFIALMAWGQNYWVYMLWNIACGLVFPLAIIPFSTYVQRTVPDQFMGRVSSLNALANTVAQPIGNLAAGVLLSRLGASNVFLIMGGGMALATLIGFSSPAFRNARMPDTETPETEKASGVEAG